VTIFSVSHIRKVPEHEQSIDHFLTFATKDKKRKWIITVYHI